MKIVVNHLTRMQQGYFCVAGLDVNTGEHVRPVLPGQRLPTSLLARYGGPFDMGVIVDLGAVKATPQKPEVEDHVFDLAKLNAAGTDEPAKFWRRLQQVARTRLRDIFGDALIPRGASSCAVDVGKGDASLGCLVPHQPPELYIRSRPGRSDQIRMRVSDRYFHLDLGVTDIRLYDADHVTPDTKVVRRVVKRLQGGLETILSVGLTRAYASSPDFNPVHWLQVNNVHPKDDPLWQLG